MKILVLYASKHGCTKDCATYLVSKLNHETTLINLTALSNTFDLQPYDWIIIGGSIHIGKIQKEVTLFCEQYLPTLLTKNICLFLCCTTPDQVNDFFKHNFPAPLLAHAKKSMNFGGDLRPEKMGFFSKKLVSMVSKSEPKEVGILYDNINSLVVFLNNQL